MNIHIVCVGKLKESYLKDAQKEYLKRLSRYCRVKVTEIDEEKSPESASPAQESKARHKEGERISKALGKGTTTIALAMEGEAFDSQAFAEYMRSLMVQGKSDITFIIGGSTGLDPSVVNSTDFRFSLSRLTFPHQLARIILLEQVYRAFKIIGNETYHK